MPSKCCNCKVVQGSDLVTLLLGIATDLSPECLMQADWAKINLYHIIHRYNFIKACSNQSKHPRFHQILNFRRRTFSGKRFLFKRIIPPWETAAKMALRRNLGIQLCVIRVVSIGYIHTSSDIPGALPLQVFENCAPLDERSRQELLVAGCPVGGLC